MHRWARASPSGGRCWPLATACPAGSASLDEVADATLSCLRRAVPAAVAGIAFLSGGQPAELATARLNAMHLRAALANPTAAGPSPGLPWPLSFSFGRALQQPAIKLWVGDDANRAAAQRALLHCARCNGAAAQGDYRSVMEPEILGS